MTEGLAAILERPAEDLARFDQLVRLLSEPGNRLDLEDLIEDAIRRESGHVATKMFTRTRFYAEMVERESNRLGGKEQLDALAKIHEQFPHIVEAVDHAMGLADTEFLAKFAANIAFPLRIQGELKLGTSVFETLLMQARETGNRSLEISAGTQYGCFLMEAGKLEEAHGILLHTLETAHSDNNKSALATILHELGNVTRLLGRFEEATAIYNQLLEHAREVSDEESLCAAQSRLGVIAMLESRSDEARQWFTKSLETARKTGNVYRIAGDLHNLAIVTIDQEEAQKLYQEALELNRSIGNRVFEARNLMQLAQHVLGKGRYDEAMHLFSNAQSIHEEIGDDLHAAIDVTFLGNVFAEMEDNERARRYYEKGIPALRKIGSKEWIAFGLDNHGILLCDLGEYQAAEPLLLEALAISEETGKPGRISSVLGNLALVSMGNGNLLDAVRYLTRALKLTLDLEVEGEELSYALVKLHHGVLLLSNAKKVQASALIGNGIDQHVKRNNMVFRKKWLRELDEAIARCSSMIGTEELHLLEQQAASISIEDLTAYALEEVEKLKTELNSQQA